MYYIYDLTHSVKKGRKKGWRKMPFALLMTLLIGCSNQFQLSHQMQGDQSSVLPTNEQSIS